MSRKRRKASDELENAEIMEVHVMVLGQGIEWKSWRAEE